jgi:hypothetical protein
MSNSIAYFRFLPIMAVAILLNLKDGKAQQLHLGIYGDPLAGWFSSDADNISGGGVRAGFSGGLAVNYYFGRNYAFSTGLSYLKTGGVQSSTEEVTFEFTNFQTTVVPGDNAVYSVSYIIIPAGLRLRTNQIGYLSVFTDIGLDPGFLNKGTISIPAAGIENEHGSKEIGKFYLGYHFHAGTEYSLGGTTQLVFGVGYESGFTDVTIDNPGQPADKTVVRLLRFRLGIFF